MEFNFSPTRSVFLIGLVGAFAAWGGFSTPEVDSEAMIVHWRRLSKAWTYCILLFLAGAVSVSVIDHFVGTVDRSSVRLLYIIFGVILMVASIMWQRGLRQAASTMAPVEEAAPSAMREPPRGVVSANLLA